MEKALNKLEGIISANVNISTNKAVVEFPSGLLEDAQLIEAIKSAGYKAEIEREASSDKEKNRREMQIKSLKRSFIISAILTLPLFAAMFYHMAGEMNILTNGYFQWALATPVQFIIGYRFYNGAYKSLRGGGANMDVLIAMGTSAAYFYSVYLVLTGSTHQFFEASAVLITIVVFGRYLEAKAKGRTSDAIRKLIGLKPKIGKMV